MSLDNPPDRTLPMASSRVRSESRATGGGYHPASRGRQTVPTRARSVRGRASAVDEYAPERAALDQAQGRFRQLGERHDARDDLVERARTQLAAQALPDLGAQRHRA